MNGLELEQNYQLINDRSQYMPENYERYACISTGADIDLQEYFEALASNYISIVPLWEFSGRGKTIHPKEPISLSINKGETLYLAENERLGIYVTGESRDAAIKAFVEELLHFYDHYKNLNWNQVAGEAQRLKKLYNDNFFENKA